MTNWVDIIKKKIKKSNNRKKYFDGFKKTNIEYIYTHYQTFLNSKIFNVF